MKKSLLIALLFFFSLQIFAQDYWMYHHELDTTFVSKNLGYEKGITITVPKVWRQDLPQIYPVIIVFDRYNQMGHQAIIRAVDNLTSSQQMPDAIVVSIDSDNKRYLETAHKINTDKSLLEANEKFLFEELLPWVEKDFHASKFRVFVGHSRYGYFTTSLLLSHFDEVSAIISLDPFFVEQNVNLTDSILKLNNLQSKYTKYYRYANGESFEQDYFAMNEALKKINNPKVDSKGIYFENCEHNAVPCVAITQEFYEVFTYWAHLQNEFYRDTTQTLKDYAKVEQLLTNHYGFPFNISYAFVNGKASELFYSGKFQEAITLWEFQLARFPNLSDIYLNIADAQKQLKVSNKETLEKYHASIIKCTMYSPEEKKELDEWEREILE